MPDACSMACSDCSSRYHLGACSGVSESTFKSKGEDYKKAWRCPECRKGTSGTPGVKECNETRFSTLLLDMNRKLDELLPLTKTVSEIEASMKNMSEKYDQILADVTKHGCEIKSIKSRVLKLEQSRTDAELLRVSAAVNDLEYQTRKLNIEIHGLKEKKDECLMTELNHLASKLELPPLTESTVTALHRLPCKADKIPGVIIRFARQSVKELWLEKRKLLATIQTGLYMSENLTAHNRTLLKTAKDWAHDNQFLFAWHRNGKVFVRKEEGDRAHLIKCVADLERLNP